MQETKYSEELTIDESADPEEKIMVHGARVHNLRNINVEIPRNKLTVITGRKSMISAGSSMPGRQRRSPTIRAKGW